MLYREQGSADAAAVAGRVKRNPDHGADKLVILALANDHRHLVIIGHHSRGLEVADMHRAESPLKSGDSNDGANVCNPSSSSKL